MARNDIVLLDSLLEKSKEQLGLEKEESEIFELFVFDQILKDYDLSFEELESGWTDGGNDGGIDGFFVFVDSRTATPESHQYALKKSPEVAVHIFSTRRSPRFEQQPLDTLIGSLSEIFDLGLKDADLKMIGDARAEIALRNSWEHVANILKERVAKSLGQFQQGTHQKKDLRFMHVLHERPLLRQR